MHPWPNQIINLFAAITESCLLFLPHTIKIKVNQILVFQNLWLKQQILHEWNQLCWTKGILFLPRLFVFQQINFIYKINQRITDYSSNTGVSENLKITLHCDCDCVGWKPTWSSSWPDPKPRSTRTNYHIWDGKI